MKTIQKRISLAMKKEDLKELEVLCKHFEENITQVLRRALMLLYYREFPEKK